MTQTRQMKLQMVYYVPPLQSKKGTTLQTYTSPGLLPRDFRETHIRNQIKEVNELIREKSLSISTLRINYIEQDHDWIGKGNCLRTKYYYRDRLHLFELGNKKLSNTITKAIKHSNLTVPMNTTKYKAIATLTGEDFPPYQGILLKRLILNFYPLRLHTKIHCSLKLLARHMITAATTPSALQKPSRK